MGSTLVAATAERHESRWKVRPPRLVKCASLNHAERAIGLIALMAASVAGLAVFPTPASSQLNVITHGFSLDEAALVEAGSRRGRIHATRSRSHETFATRPYHYRPNYRYFGADPDRYFGIGPGSYECFGFDCNW